MFIKCDFNIKTLFIDYYRLYLSIVLKHDIYRALSTSIGTTDSGKTVWQCKPGTLSNIARIEVNSGSTGLTFDPCICSLKSSGGSISNAVLNVHSYRHQFASGKTDACSNVLLGIGRVSVNVGLSGELTRRLSFVYCRGIGRNFPRGLQPTFLDFHRRQPRFLVASLVKIKEFRGLLLPMAAYAYGVLAKYMYT